MGMILALSLLALFCLPGTLLARAMFSDTRNYGFLIAAGFIVSLASFAVLAWPWLWLKSDPGPFWRVLGPWWGAYLAISLAAHRRVARRPSPEPIVPPAVDGQETPDGSGWARFTSIVLLAYLVWAGVIADQARPMLNWRTPWSWESFALLATLLVFGAVLGSGLSRPLLVRHAREACSSPPLAWLASAWVAAIAVVVAATLWSQPQLDDAYYLSAVRQFAAGGPLNREDPTLPGEGFPVAPHMRLLAWELFGATLSRFSGVHPMILHFTLLPPILVALVIAVHWELLERRLVGRRLAPLAILGLIGFWLFCNSGVFSPGYCLLTRPWQGKSLLWLLGLPLVVVTLWEYLSAPSWFAWIGCALTITGVLALSSSAVFLLAVLIPAFCLAMAVAGTERRWPILLGSVASGFGVGIYGLFIRSSIPSNSILNVRVVHESWRRSLFHCVNTRGASLFVWIMLLPPLAAMITARGARAILVWVPVGLALTVLSPAAFDVVAGGLTSYHTYYRLFWLLPMGLGTAVGLALAADYISSSFRWPSRAPHRSALPLMLAFVCGLASLPDHFAWSYWDPGTAEDPGICWRRNLYKVPDDLLPLLGRLDGGGPAEGRCLFQEKLSMFVSPYYVNRAYVSTRKMYTVDACAAALEQEDGSERVDLSTRFLAGRMEDGPATRLVARLGVTSVLVEHPSGAVEQQLERLGFRRAQQSGPYQLWERPLPRGETS